MDKNRELYTIFIRLLDEGTDVWRPTQGEKIRDNIYKTLPCENYDSKDENWEFKPGSIVECRNEIHCGEKAMVAFKLVEL